MTEQTKAEAGAKLAERIRYNAAQFALPSWMLDALADYDAATKPRTITVNGVEVPEPVRKALQAGDPYWKPDLTADDFVRPCNWVDGASERALQRGLIHLTREAAESHARALIGASEKEQQA